jgi:hypothetical protein
MSTALGDSEDEDDQPYVVSKSPGQTSSSGPFQDSYELYGNTGINTESLMAERKINHEGSDSRMTMVAKVKSLLSASSATRTIGQDLAKRHCVDELCVNALIVMIDAALKADPAIGNEAMDVASNLVQVHCDAFAEHFEGSATREMIFKKYAAHGRIETFKTRTGQAENRRVYKAALDHLSGNTPTGRRKYKSAIGMYDAARAIERGAVPLEVLNRDFSEEAPDLPKYNKCVPTTSSDRRVGTFKFVHPDKPTRAGVPYGKNRLDNPYVSEEGSEMTFKATVVTGPQMFLEGSNGSHSGAPSCETILIDPREVQAAFFRREASLYRTHPGLALGSDGSLKPSNAAHTIFPFIGCEGKGSLYSRHTVGHDGDMQFYPVDQHPTYTTAWYQRESEKFGTPVKDYVQNQRHNEERRAYLHDLMVNPIPVYLSPGVDLVEVETTTHPHRQMSGYFEAPRTDLSFGDPFELPLGSRSFGGMPPWKQEGRLVDCFRTDFMETIVHHRWANTYLRSTQEVSLTGVTVPLAQLLMTLCNQWNIKRDNGKRSFSVIQELGGQMPIFILSDMAKTTRKLRHDSNEIDALTVALLYGLCHFFLDTEQADGTVSNPRGLPPRWLMNISGDGEIDPRKGFFVNKVRFMAGERLDPDEDGFFYPLTKVDPEQAMPALEAEGTEIRLGSAVGIVRLGRDGNAILEKRSSATLSAAAHSTKSVIDQTLRYIRERQRASDVTMEIVAQHTLKQLQKISKMSG